MLPRGVSPPKNLPLGSPNPYSSVRRISLFTHKSGPEKTPPKNIGNLNKGWQGDPQWSHKWIQNPQFEGGVAKVKTVLPCTREHNFQGFGGSRFGPFRHPLPNLCQRPLKTPLNTKNYKNRPPKGYRFSWPRCPGITLWGSLNYNGGFKIGFSCIRVPSKLRNSTKMEPQRWKRHPILCNERQKRHCSHDPVDASANTFARATSWILPSSQGFKTFFLGRRVTQSV